MIAKPVFLAISPVLPTVLHVQKTDYSDAAIKIMSCFSANKDTCVPIFHSICVGRHYFTAAAAAAAADNHQEVVPKPYVIDTEAIRTHRWKI